MHYKTTLIIGITFSGLAVVIGAFGAHLLKEILSQYGRTETFDLAVRYQFYHAFALIATGILQKTESLNFRWAAVSFIMGILFFSGSLYALSLTGIKTFGAITPIGGVLFIAGWIMLLIALLKRTR